MKASFLKKLISRYKNNKASKAERFILEKWYESFDHNKESPFWLTDPDANREFQDRILAATFKSKKVPLNRPGIWLRYAAAIFLVSATGIYVYNSKLFRENDKREYLQSYATKAGELRTVVLPDSTEVQLNANSTLQVATDYAKNSRNVRLKGEAFFRVKKDASHPFTIQTSDLSIKVLGTSFNVRAYEKLRQIAVSVSTGLVSVSNSTNTLAKLKAHRQIVYNRETKAFKVSAFESDNDRSWIDGTVRLDKADFNDLKQSFLNIYGIELVSENQEVLNASYNITIRKTRTVVQALDHLSALTGMRYRKEGEAKAVLY